MARLTPIHWKKLVCVFQRAGFRIERQTSSHIVLVKEGVLRPVIIPKYSEEGLDIIKNCMRTAGMNRKDFFRFLAQC